jgi:uncharacterized protein YqgV (UPF0045/DUF77 family)
VAPEKGAPRIGATLKIGTRTGRVASVDEKVRSVDEKMCTVQKKL